MNEEQVKKRGWIKNAVIVFLSVMLILTFFSNTFMNRSLAEVSTKYVTSGEITTQVRGGGTVTANENYNVTLPQTRTVESVKVKVGDEVNEGDVLFTLSGNVSDELRAAEDRVYELNLAYQKALITAATGEGTQGDRDIQRAKEDLEIAQEDYNSYTNNGQLSKRQAKSEMDAAQSALDTATAEVKKLERQLENTSGSGGNGTDSDTAYAALQRAVAAKNAAQAEFDAKYATWGRYYKSLVERVIEDRLQAAIDDAKKANPNTDSNNYKNIEAATNSVDLAKLKTHLVDWQLKHFQSLNTPSWSTASEGVTDANVKAGLNLINQYFERNWQSKIDGYVTAALDGEGYLGFDGTAIKAENEKEKEAYETLKPAADKVYAENVAYNEAYSTWANSGDSSSGEYKRVKNLLNKAIDAQTVAQSNFNAKEAIYKGIDESGTALNTAITNLEKLEQDAKIAALDLDSQRRQIARAQQDLAELQHDSTEPEVRAKVSGIIGEINVTAGKEAAANETLCTITVPDMGYNVSITVTSEQARMVRVGEEASIANNWRGDLSATVSNIKTDPKNPQSSKIITFDIKGDVEPGTTLNLTVGSRGSQYDTIVPNSALRSDSNGDFVLVVTSRNSPLGNRYIATRVNVEKKASDDNNTAVTGELNAYDYVITTSSKPIKDKDMVRLAGE